MPHIEIRAAVDSDAGALRDLLVATGWDGASLMFRPSGLELPGFVAIDGAKIIGMVDGQYDVDFVDRLGSAGLGMQKAWVDRIAIEPGTRRQSIGSRLMHRFAEEARSKGAEYVALMAAEFSGKASRTQFFAACGMTALNPNEENDLFGARIADVLRATAR